MATTADLARFLTAHKLRVFLSPPNGLINMAVSDSSNISQRLLDAATRTTKKRKRFLQLAGQRFPTILCKFEIVFEDFECFRKISYHSLVGLEHGAMLLLGGWIHGSASQTGIWKLKDEKWTRIGEFSQV
jgi:hypothetical protein